jgi:hypothetical protein
MTDRVAVFAISSEDMGMGRADLDGSYGREERDGEGKYGDRNLLVRPLNADGKTSSDIRGNLYTKVALADDYSCIPTPSDDLCRWLAGDKLGSNTVSHEVTDFIAETAWRHVMLDKPSSNGTVIGRVIPAIKGGFRRYFSGDGGQRGGGAAKDEFLKFIDNLHSGNNKREADIDKVIDAAVDLFGDITTTFVISSLIKDKGISIADYLKDTAKIDPKVLEENMNKYVADYYRRTLRNIVSAMKDKIPTDKQNYSDIKKEDLDAIKVKFLTDNNWGTEMNMAIALDQQFKGGLPEGVKKGLENAAVKAVVHTVENQYANNATTVAQSQHAKDLLENVYKRWDSLKDDTQLMYASFLEVQERVAGSAASMAGGATGSVRWRTITPDEYSTKFGPGCSDNLDNLRIALNLSGDGTTTRFEDRIPLIPMGRFDTIAFTGPGNKVETRTLRKSPKESKSVSKATPYTGPKYPTVVTGGGEIGNRALRDIYHSIYALGIPRVTSDSVDGSQMEFPSVNTFRDTYKDNTMFTFKSSDLVRDRLYDLARAERTTRKPSDVDDSFFGPSGFLDMIDANTWSRVSPGVYQKVDASGKTVRYGREDEATRRMFKSSAHGCYTTLYNAPAAKCDKYIHQCLLNGDKDSMATCLAAKTLETEFFKNSKKGINEMHPLIALRTLQKFGFREHDVYDNQAGTTIRKIESVDHWKNSDFMKERFKDSKGAALPIDDILTQYLELVTEFVNSNPGILNSGFRGQTDEGVGHLVSSDYVRSLGIKQRVEPSHGKGKFYSRLGTHMKTSMYGNSHNLSPFRASASGYSTPYGSMRTLGITGVLQGRQHGGADSGVILRGFNEASDAPHGAVFISEVVKSALNDLRNSGRYIKNDDLRQIDSTLNRISKDEEKLLKLVAMIEQYNRMMESHKDYKVEGLSLGKLKEMVDKYSTVAGRYFNDQQAVQVLLSAFEKQSPDKGRPIDITNGHA